MPLWRRWAVVGIITILLGGLLVGLRSKGKLEPLELLQYDWTTSVLAKGQSVPDVVLISISDNELGKWGWPVADMQIAQLVKTVLDDGAAAVGIDIYRDRPAGEGREDLIEILKSPRVFVVSKLPSGKDAGITAPEGAQAGFSDIPIDPDGVARRALLLVNTADGIALSLPLRMASAFSNRQALQTSASNPRNLSFGDTDVGPLEPGTNLFRNVDTAGYQIVIDYQNALPVVQHIPAMDVLAKGAAGQFENKAVIIGVTSHSVKDYFLTPLNRSTGADFAFGAELHAAIVQQLIDYARGARPVLRSLNDQASAVLVFMSVFLAASLAVFMRKTLYAMGCAVLGGTVLFLGLSLFQKNALLMPVSASFLGWAIGFLAGFTVIAVVSRNQRRVIAQVFSSHLSDALSQEIWQQRKKLLSGGKPRSQRLFVTALLADIEGSTRIGNAMNAGDFMAWVSRLLDRLGEVARDHGGFVEKFTGDGILVIFGAPVPSETDAEHRANALAALRCAHALRAATLALNTGDGQPPPYRLRVALNSGEAIGGTLGVSGSLHYNVIGDTINVAARLENRIKTLSPDAEGFRPVCMTQATADLIDAQRDWPVLSSFRHDDGATEILVIEAKAPKSLL